MQILLSEIQITPVKPQKGLLAFCSFVINGSFYVGSVGIYSRLGSEGYRLAYPDKILNNGLKIECFYPINKDAAEAIEKQVIYAFQQLLDKVCDKPQEKWRP